jgi:acetate kinase
VRAQTCDRFDYLGLKIDASKNEKAEKGKQVDISADDSKVRVLVIPTNEELVIARDTIRIVSDKQ